ncbi:conserved hypothetical protein [Mesorhizobium ventifaucium]|uniref:Uncharacterized protein n=1 Tax=Mesorhizobium ventifaucium TaxID=666020 RepID=A0ABM9DV09_9HYPH|nr:conserved hypothetical protein [Mesorhizobium ventifaucium]
MVSPSLTMISVARGSPPAVAMRGASGCDSLNGFATVPVAVRSTRGAAGAEAVRAGLAAGADAVAGCDWSTGGNCWVVTGSRLERLTDWVWLPSSGAAETAASPG